MSLKLYIIDTTIRHEDDMAGIKKEFRTLYSFFRLGVGDEKKIKKMQLNFFAGKGYKITNIEKTDYIFCPVAPLFSCRFVEKVGQLLKDDITFYPCSLTCQDQRLNWYAAKINRSIPLIDTDKSIYKMLDDDVKLLEKESYREDISEIFYIAKDERHQSRFFVSELFKNLCDENNLHINFKQVSPMEERKQDTITEDNKKSLYEE